MAQIWTGLGAIDPKALVEARLQAHYAAQWLTRAARANLAAKPDDSHTNLDWDERHHALSSHELDTSGGDTIRFGLRLGSLTLTAAKDAERLGEFALDGKRDAEAGVWIDAMARSAGLRAPSSALLPYTLPTHPVAAGGRYSCASRRAEFSELAHWYEAAGDILRETRERIAEIGTGVSAVRCWPHHFDIATSLNLRSGDPETAPSIGIGMSPGDDYYAQPYFYVSPWPRPTSAALPDLPSPGHWHIRDFVGAVATGAALLASADRRATARDFLDAAIAAARRLLDAC
jgi:hypothetical protein